MKLSKEITREITSRLKIGKSLPTKGRYLPTAEEPFLKMEDPGICQCFQSCYQNALVNLWQVLPELCGEP